VVELDRVEVLEVVGRAGEEEQVVAQAVAWDPGLEVQEVAAGRAGEDRVAEAVREAGEQAGPEAAQQVRV